jgi:hypothetical protein
LTINKVLHNLAKTWREINTLIGVFYKTLWAKSFFTEAIRGVLLMAKRMKLNCITFIHYPKNVFGSITYHFTLCEVLQKPTNKTIWVESFPPSSWKGYYSCPESFNYIIKPHLGYPKMPYILIQVNERKAKLDTLMVEGYGKAWTKL